MEPRSRQRVRALGARVLTWALLLGGAASCEEGRDRLAAGDPPSGTAGAALSGAPESPDFSALDGALERAVAEGRIPGAVLQVSRSGRVLHRRAVGAVEPGGAPLAGDERFDLASLTKPMVTATVVLALVSEGRLGLADELADRLPGFDRARWAGVTVERLLRHTAGLVPDHPLAFHADGAGPALERIAEAGTAHAPGERFVYSDVGYLLLQALVEHVTGESLDRTWERVVRTPLGLDGAGFGPLAEGVPRVPTRDPDLGRLSGVVHDPRARALGGVAGHAGLFADVTAVARFADWLAGGLPVEGLEPVRAGLLDVRWSAAGTDGRSLGLAVDGAFASARGTRFPRGRSLGHTGFTGTSFWCDPQSGLSVVLLTSRTLLDDGAVGDLRTTVADLAWEALLGPADPGPPVRSGADVLAAEDCRRLAGRRVGLLTHHAGRTRDGVRSVDLLARAPDVQLLRLFSPEHGIESRGEGDQQDGVDAATGLPVHSLYGDRRRPHPAQLQGLDDLVVDLQDVGVRIYTYPATVLAVLEACHEAHVRVVVLDRPGPLLFAGVDGPTTDPGRTGFVNCGDWPWLPGMTLGELALMLRAERVPEVQLEVVPCEGLRRSTPWEATGQPWRDPSPNLRSPEASLLYASLGVLEAMPLSVGRGTDEPFERLGAPWLDGPRLAEALRRRELPGVVFTPIEFVPDTGPHAGQTCGGVHVRLTDPGAWRPLRTGLTLAWELERAHGEAAGIEALDRRLAHRATWEALRRCTDPAELEGTWSAACEAFETRRAPYLLYPD